MHIYQNEKKIATSILKITLFIIAVDFAVAEEQQCNYDEPNPFQSIPPPPLPQTKSARAYSGSRLHAEFKNLFPSASESLERMHIIDEQFDPESGQKFLDSALRRASENLEPDEVMVLHLMAWLGAGGGLLIFIFWCGCFLLCVCSPEACTCFYKPLCRCFCWPVLCFMCIFRRSRKQCTKFCRKRKQTSIGAKARAALSKS